MTVVAVSMLSAPARAGDLTYAHIWTLWSGNTATLCAEGRADVEDTRVGEWTYTVAGARSDGGVVAPDPQLVDGPLFFTQCLTIEDDGAAYGSFSAQLTFSGVAPFEPTAQAFLVAEWSPVTGPREFFYWTN
jgi:hypothetical protein